jgi:hypothetical protein
MGRVFERPARARPRITNVEIAQVLRELGLFLEMDGVPFKPRAYEKAAFAVASVESPLCLFHPTCRSLGQRPPIDFDSAAGPSAARC